MFSKGQKALLMIGDPQLHERAKGYLYSRYNLEADSAEGILEVFSQINNQEEDYELVILDEAVEGLSTTSQTLKTIKDQCTSTNVLYLSTLMEMAEPYWETEMVVPSEVTVEEFREEWANDRIDRLFTLHTPLTNANSLEDVYRLTGERLGELFLMDFGFVSILLQEDGTPVEGKLVWQFPKVGEEELEFDLGDGRLSEMARYYKPIHIPDLEVDKKFQKELEEIFGKTFRSVLLLPMQILGNCLGFLGVFTEKQTRLYNLVDIDMGQRLADISALAILTILYTQSNDIQVKMPDERVLGESIER